MQVGIIILFISLRYILFWLFYLNFSWNRRFNIVLWKQIKVLWLKQLNWLALLHLEWSTVSTFYHRRVSFMCSDHNTWQRAVILALAMILTLCHCTLDTFIWVSITTHLSVLPDNRNGFVQLRTEFLITASSLKDGKFRTTCIFLAQGRT